MTIQQRRIVAYLDALPPSLRFGDASRQAKVNALREPHKGVILQVKGAEELRPFFGRTLTLSPRGMPSVLDRAFKGEL